MKIFANKKIWKKLVLVLLLITVFAFVVPRPVHADIGGTLMKPIINLIIGLGDGIINILHRFILGQEETLIRINLTSGLWSTLVTFAACLVIGLVAGAIAVGVGAVTATVAAAVAAVTTIGVGILSATGTFPVAAVINYIADGWDEELVIPVYSISPEEIFKGEVPLFDVNFFDPDTEYYTYDSYLYKLDTSSYTTKGAMTSDEVESKWGAGFNEIYSGGTLLAEYTETDGYDAIEELVAGYLVEYEDGSTSNSKTYPTFRLVEYEDKRIFSFRTSLW